jgi:hypothetical protein
LANQNFRLIIIKKGGSMKLHLSLLSVIGIIFGACNSNVNAPELTEDLASQIKGIDVAKIVRTEADLEPCIPAHYGRVYFIEDTEQLVFCNGKTYQKIQLSLSEEIVPPGDDDLNFLGSFDQHPDSAEINDFYTNSQDKTSYLWNGQNWMVIMSESQNKPLFCGLNEDCSLKELAWFTANDKRYNGTSDARQLARENHKVSFSVKVGEGARPPYAIVGVKFKNLLKKSPSYDFQHIYLQGHIPFGVKARVEFIQSNIAGFQYWGYDLVGEGYSEYILPVKLLSSLSGGSATFDPTQVEGIQFVFRDLQLADHPEEVANFYIDVFGFGVKAMNNSTTTTIRTEPIQQTDPIVIPIPSEIIVNTNNLSNVALNKTTKQSSNWNAILGTSDKAVDGNTSPKWETGINNTITHTRREKQPWWEVDLGEVHSNIHSIIVHRRTDCCLDRLQDYWILVSETEFKGTSLNHSINDLQVRAFQVTGEIKDIQEIILNVPGRFIRIQLPNTQILNLAEVRVMSEGKTREPMLIEPIRHDGLINVAFGKTSYQSSNHHAVDGHALRATDGNTSTFWETGINNTMSMTRREREPWWEVDLGETYASIKEISIYYRSDCCTERIKDARIFISDEPFKGSSVSFLEHDPNVFNFAIDGVPEQGQRIPINRSGRFVRIQLPGTNYLNLSEVMVFSDGRLKQ